MLVTIDGENVSGPWRYLKLNKAWACSVFRNRISKNIYIYTLKKYLNYIILHFKTVITVTLAQGDDN